MHWGANDRGVETSRTSVMVAGREADEPTTAAGLGKF